MRLQVVFLSILLTACSTPPKQDDTVLTDSKVEPDRELFYHYSLWTALANEIYDGKLTVRELKTMGDIGLGTYNGLDGELVMLEGVVYQVLEDGTVVQPSEEMLIPWTNVTFFDIDQTLHVKEPVDYEGLRMKILETLPSDNYFFALKISGVFNRMKCGSIQKQERPYDQSLEELVAKRPVFEQEKIKGTMVGFLCPEFIGDINVAGFHLHFISEDRQFGGHVIEFEAGELNVQMDKTNTYQFVLPDTEDFGVANFEKSFEYGN